MKVKIEFRGMSKEDYPLLLAWRNDPDIRQGFYFQSVSKHIITWDEHVAWMKSRNPDWKTFMIMLIEENSIRPVGVVTIGQLDHWSPEIGYYIGEKSLWGQGIGKEAVRLALEYIKQCGREYVHTTILDNNTRSIGLIKSLGFEYLGPARPGESWYQKKL